MDSLLKRQKQIIEFGNSAEFKALDAYYAQPSIFSALGVSRHENTHSNFLAWLLTPRPEKNDHGLGDLPLRKFLETLTLACALPHSLGKIPLELSAPIATSAYSLSGITVEREKAIDAGRLDIYIGGQIKINGSVIPLTIVIENKIKSSEHDSQTARYLDSLRRSVSCSGLFLSVYLTPLPNRDYERLSGPTCEAKEFIELNYQYLANYVIEPCRNSVPEGSIKRYLDEYLLTLSLPETRQNKGDIVMAINKEERELLARFWEKHRDLLTAVMLSIGDCVPLEDNEAEIIQKASNVIGSAMQRDLSRYSLMLSNKQIYGLSKRGLVQEVITNYALNNPRITVSELCEKFTGAVLPLEIAKTKNAACYNLWEDKLIRCADGLAAVYNQWRADNIKRFISDAEKLGYIISSTE